MGENCKFSLYFESRNSLYKGIPFIREHLYRGVGFGVGRRWGESFVVVFF